MEPFMKEKNHENQYGKKLDPVDAYLVSVIDRFFNTQKVKTDAAVEKIITAAIARYKGLVNYKDKGVRSFNGMEGIVHYTLQSLGVMEKTVHKTAFNKDFGIKENEVCEGNDERLSDERIPEQHAHLMVEVRNLGIIFQKLKIESSRYGRHEHNNFNSLLKIKCTKPIDLKNIEDARFILSEKLNTLKQKQAELESIEQQYRFLLEKIIVTQGAGGPS